MRTCIVFSQWYFNFDCSSNLQLEQQFLGTNSKERDSLIKATTRSEIIRRIKWGETFKKRQKDKKAKDILKCFNIGSSNVSKKFSKGLTLSTSSLFSKISGGSLNKNVYKQLRNLRINFEIQLIQKIMGQLIMWSAAIITNLNEFERYHWIRYAFDSVWLLTVLKSIAIDQ